MEKNGLKFFIEVKGCTLEKNGIGYFPDAPTERGVKHLRELINAQKNGYICSVGFVIQMEGIHEVKANIEKMLAGENGACKSKLEIAKKKQEIININNQLIVFLFIYLT